MILKSYIVEQNIEILKNYKAVLIYGINGGIKDDVKDELKHQNKDCEIITFFEADIIKSNLLFKNIANQSLFTNKKIIFILEASDKVFNQVKECIELENNETQIYLFSENLEKKSKLRSYFEKDKNLGIFPCYEDNEQTLVNYVNKKLKDFRGLTGEITNLIINNSNMDRRIIRAEIDKIEQYFIDKKIEIKQISEILNIKNDTAFEKIRDKALMGEKSKVNRLLSETEILSEEAFFYLNALNFRFMRLHEIVRLNEDNNNFEKTLESLKPPIFWKDKPIIILQLKKWSRKKIEEILEKIVETEVLMKKNSHIRNDIVIKNLILKLTDRASTSA
ncbi:hypothetical protein OAM08_02005 [Pelagibacteraceae bacterium]|nr:hypothetical protein [Pelagibacteraceae bacterium]